MVKLVNEKKIVISLFVILPLVLALSISKTSWGQSSKWGAGTMGTMQLERALPGKISGFQNHGIAIQYESRSPFSQSQFREMGKGVATREIRSNSHGFNKTETLSHSISTNRTIEIPVSNRKRWGNNLGSAKGGAVITPTPIISENSDVANRNTKMIGTQISTPKPPVRSMAETKWSHARFQEMTNGGKITTSPVQQSRKINSMRTEFSRSRADLDFSRVEGGNRNHAQGAFDDGRSVLKCYERPHIGGGHRHPCYQRFGCYPGQIFHPIVWPSYHYPVCYDFGPHFNFHYIFPYYHRKYIFVSLGGYWPWEYRYIRYYWYPCHLFWWYGDYPVAYEVRGDTYNYYTYNYNTYSRYNTNDPAASALYQKSSNGDNISSHGFSDEDRKVEEQPLREPAKETLADRYFEEGVKAFETGDYHLAAAKFADALQLEPEDMILPFAYVQALFANQEYAKAADILRKTVKQLPSDQLGIYFPRGLYSDDNILFEHIDCLTARAERYPFDPDLQLLLGYQLLGVGKYDQAKESLQKACLDPATKISSKVMLALLERIKANTN